MPADDTTLRDVLSSALLGGALGFVLAWWLAWRWGVLSGLDAMLGGRWQGRGRRGP